MKKSGTHNEQAEGIPTLPARRITRPDGVTLLAFVCASCGRSVTHGLPKGCSLPTHRLAHCPCYPRGYYLTTKGAQS